MVDTEWQRMKTEIDKRSKALPRPPLTGWQLHGESGLDDNIHVIDESSDQGRLWNKEPKEPLKVTGPSLFAPSHH